MAQVVGNDYKVFVSHGSTDLWIASQISKEVQARDASGIYPELRDAIEAYRELTPGSVFIVPIRFSKCDIPPLRIDATLSLDSLQRIDLFPPSKRASGFDALVQSLKAAPNCPVSREPPRNIQTGSSQQSATAATIKRPLDETELRKALTNLSPTDFATILANVPGALNQVPEQGTTAERVARLIQWAESHGGPGLIEIGRIAAEALPNFR